MPLALNTDSTKVDFGDMSSNAALIIGKDQKINPRVIAQTMVDAFKHECI